jgi:hypothetical protein
MKSPFEISRHGYLVLAIIFISALIVLYITDSGVVNW